MSGQIEELTDYYPYGGLRLEQIQGGFSEQRKFTGHEYDVDTGLYYYGARYYNGSIGHFINQDPELSLQQTLI
jgi:RHS repeat-associated protein